MTVSTHAFGGTVTVLPARTRRVAVHRKPVSRQLRAQRIMLAVAATIAAVVLVGTAQQIAVHGWKAFVFRAPGVGGTPAHPAAAKPGASAVPPVAPHATATKPPASYSHDRAAPTAVPSPAAGGGVQQLGQPRQLRTAQRERSDGGEQPRRSRPRGVPPPFAGPPPPRRPPPGGRAPAQRPGDGNPRGQLPRR
ncbi:MAG: hypothetical protein ACTHK4_04750 [Mycobacteriales bacterium]